MYCITTLQAVHTARDGQLISCLCRWLYTAHDCGRIQGDQIGGGCLHLNLAFFN